MKLRIFSHKRPRQQQRHGRAQQGQHCHGRVVDQNDGQRGQKLRQPQDKGRDPAKHAARHIRDVRVDAAEQIAGVELLQGFPVRVQEHAEDLGAQLIADAEVDLCTETADKSIEHDGRACQQHDDNAAEQHAPSAALQIDDGVDELTRGETRQQAQRNGGDAEQYIGRNGAAVALAVVQDPARFDPEVVQRCALQAVAEL